MEYNTGELASIYKQVHHINKEKLKQIKQVEDLINFHIATPTHSGAYSAKLDPLFHNTERVSMADIEHFIQTHRESMQNTYKTQGISKPIMQNQASQSPQIEPTHIQDFADLISNDSQSEVTSAKNSSDNLSQMLPTAIVPSHNKIYYQSSSIKNINDNQLNAIEPKIKRRAHKIYNKEQKCNTSVPSKIPFEGAPICPDDDMKYYKMLNAKNTEIKSKVITKKSVHMSIKYDKMHKIKEILNNLNRSSIVESIPPQEPKENQHTVFNLKRNFKHFIKTPPKDPGFISDNPYFSENPYKFLPKRFRRNPRFALSFKGKEFAPMEEANTANISPHKEIPLPLLKKEVLIPKTHSMEAQIPLEKIDEQETNAMNVINFTNAIEVRKPSKKTESKNSFRSSRQSYIKKCNKKAIKYKEDAPNLPIQPDNSKIVCKIKTIIKSRKQSTKKDAHKRSLVMNKDVYRNGMDLSNIVTPLMNDSNLRMPSIIDELYSNEMKFKRKQGGNTLADNELIFDLSRLRNINIKERKYSIDARLPLVSKQESVSTFLLSAFQ